MLKAVQILGSSSSSSGLVSSFSQTLKLKKKAPHPNCVCEFFLISRKSIATTTTISLSSRKSAPFLLQVHRYSHKGHFSNFRASTMSLAHTESNPDGPSSSSSPASAVTIHSSAGSTRKINFCQSCGGPTKHDIPDGEEKMRAICTICGKIAYENPKMERKTYILYIFWMISSHEMDGL